MIGSDVAALNNVNVPASNEILYNLYDMNI